MNLDGKRIILVGGPGGVGKTTLAAALGLALSKQRKKTVILTVDPARRLAQALGMQDFSSDLQRVGNNESEHQLFASMLDTQRYFDRIITRFAQSDTQRDKILKHPFYRIMVESLGGTHEYAAMERLLEFATDPSYDTIIVDTPPSQNAVDLLSAPQRLAEFMDGSVLKWFQGSRPILGLFRTGTKLAMKLLQKVFGSEFIEKLSEVLDDLEGMQAGFQKRHLEVLEILKNPSTTFLIVSYPSEVRFTESHEFVKSLLNQRMALGGILLNRVEPGVSSELLAADLPADLKSLLTYFAELKNQQLPWIAKFQELAKTKNIPCIELQRTEANLHDTIKLSEVGQGLLQ